LRHKKLKLEQKSINNAANQLREAFAQLDCEYQDIAIACGVKKPAVSQWLKRGRLPYSELTGATNYAEIIAGLSGGKLTRADLLPPVEKSHSFKAFKKRLENA